MAKKPKLDMRSMIRSDSTLQQANHDALNDFQGMSGTEAKLSMSSVHPNPRNPRRLPVTPEDIKALTDKASTSEAPGTPAWRAYWEKLIDAQAYDDKKERFIKGLVELACSIKAEGLMQPIVVAKRTGQGADYQIRAGERRYFAHLLLGEGRIRAMVRPHEQDEVRVMLQSLIENLQRENLSYDDRLLAVRSVAEQWEQMTGKSISAKALMEMTHESQSQCYRYMDALKADDAFWEEVKAGRLNTRPKVEDYLNAPLKKQVEVKPAPKKPAGGAPKKYISLGRTTNPKVIQQVFDEPDRLVRVIQEIKPQVDSLDWSDPKAVQDAWKMVLGRLEKESR